MSTNTLNVSLLVTSSEVLDAADFPGAGTAGERTLGASGYTTQDTLTATSTPALEKAGVIQEVAIGGSPTVIDLTAVDIGVGRTEDMTGKKLIAYVFNAAAANAGSVTVDAHSSNGYNLFGTSGLLVLVPGRRVASTIEGVVSGEATVSASLANIRIAGTAADVVQVGLWFGT
jgi:hypothetical protein